MEVLYAGHGGGRGHYHLLRVASRLRIRTSFWTYIRHRESGDLAEVQKEHNHWRAKRKNGNCEAFCHEGSDHIVGLGCASVMGSLLADRLLGFLVGATEERAIDTIQLSWKQDHPVWVDQLPLPEEKLHALEAAFQRTYHSDKQPMEHPGFCNQETGKKQMEAPPRFAQSE